MAETTKKKAVKKTVKKDSAKKAAKTPAAKKSGKKPAEKPAGKKAPAQTAREKPVEKPAAEEKQVAKEPSETQKIEVKEAVKIAEKKKSAEKKPKHVEKIKNIVKHVKFKLKKKKPKFKRQEHGLRKKLADTWRRPRGIDSKQLEEKRGKGKVPKIGYKNPDTGIIAGLRPTMVTSVADIRAMDAKTEGAMIAKQVGRKKRNMIIQEANKLNIAILNPRKGER